jgi:anti-sigma B factor antagonist
MKTKLSEIGKTAVIAPEGRLDAMAADSFNIQTDGVLYKKPKSILVDLSGLEYISSAGLRSVLGLVRKADASKTPLSFCALSPLVHEVFEVAGFYDILSIFDSREEALKHLGG